MRQTISFACAILLLLGAESAHAQTVQQLRSEGEFNRALIRARDAGDCSLALRLLDERESVLRSHAAKFTRRYPDLDPRSHNEAAYLVTQIRGIENRRAIMRKECGAPRG